MVNFLNESVCDVSLTSLTIAAHCDKVLQHFTHSLKFKWDKKYSGPRLIKPLWDQLKVVLLTGGFINRVLRN